MRMGAGSRSHGGTRIRDRRVRRMLAWWIARRGWQSSTDRMTTLGPGIGPWARTTRGNETTLDTVWTGKGSCTSSFGGPAGEAGRVGPEAVGGVNFGARHGRNPGSFWLILSEAAVETVWCRSSSWIVVDSCILYGIPRGGPRLVRVCA